jgi:hypothetical protein
MFATSGTVGNRTWRNRVICLGLFNHAAGFGPSVFRACVNAADITTLGLAPLK